MTIEVEVPEVSFDYAGPGDYPFKFEIADIVDVAVKYVTENELIIELVRNSDYTVAASPGIDGGTLTVLYDDPVGGPYTGILEIYRVTPIDQQTDYDNNDPFDMDVLERSLDKLTMICQDLSYTMSVANLTSHYRGIWAPAVTYFVNDLVQYPDEKGNWYASLTTHDSGTTFEGDAAYWTMVLDTGSVYQDVLRAEAAALAAAESASSAYDSSELAYKWANNPLNVPVNNTGQYSAMHWAAIAQLSAGSGLSWFYPWVPNEYPPMTFTNDSGWAMISNKTTADRPAPQAVGDAYWLYAATMSETSDTAKQIIFGTRYSPSVSGYVTSYRVYTKADNVYSIYLVKDSLGTPIFDSLVTFTATSDGWQELPVTSTLFAAGVTFDLVAFTTETGPTETAWEGVWIYDTPNNIAVPPAGGVVQADKEPGLIRFAILDDDDNDVHDDLIAVEVGDSISTPGAIWTVQSVRDDVAGNYVEYGVSPSSQASTDGSRNFTFSGIAATPILYAEDLDYWVGVPTQGILAIDTDYNNSTISDTAYGIDLKVQEAFISPDWDVVAHSTDTGSAGGGGSVEEAPNDGHRYVRELEAWSKTYPVDQFSAMPMVTTNWTINASQLPFAPMYPLNTAGGAITITIPTATDGGYETGSVISFYQLDGSAAATLAGANGVVIRKPPNKLAIPRGLSSVMSIFYISNTYVVVYGDLRDA